MIAAADGPVAAAGNLDEGPAEPLRTSESAPPAAAAGPIASDIEGVTLPALEPALMLPGPPLGTAATDPYAGLSADEVAGFNALQARIGVSFRRRELLREAMTHASWNNERGEPSGPGHDNERLEYLGDAVLELVVGEYLFRRFPSYDEGQLTQLRAALVNTVSLARLAERLGLGNTLLLGRGAAKTGARRLPSLLANAFEAMTGAIFLDHGYRVATRVFVQNIGDLADWTDDNFKGRLQEVAQERTGAPPLYRVLPQTSGSHRAYSAEAVVGGQVVGRGTGGTKQAAQQAAARVAIERLSQGQASATTRAAGAARTAARGAAAEPARVRRRVTEVAADRGASSARQERTGQPVPAAPPAAPPPRRGLLATLRAAAEAIVGRREEPEPPPAPAKRQARRGHRGGRGRGSRGGGGGGAGGAGGAPARAGAAAGGLLSGTAGGPSGGAGTRGGSARGGGGPAADATRAKP